MALADIVSSSYLGGGRKKNKLSCTELALSNSVLMSATAPTGTVGKCLHWNGSPHSLFMSWRVTHDLPLVTGINIVLMVILLLLQGFLGSPGPPGKDGAKGEAVSLFVPPHVIPAFRCEAGSGNQSVLSETCLGDLCGHFRSSRNKWQEVNSPSTLPHTFAGVLWISHPDLLPEQLCYHSLRWKREQSWQSVAWGPLLLLCWLIAPTPEHGHLF